MNSENKSAKFKLRYVYIFSLMFLAYIGLDQIFRCDIVKLYSQNDFTYMYFDYKPELIDQLAEMSASIQEQRTAARVDASMVPRKIMLVFGSSHFLYIDYAGFDQNFPDWEMYNFSAPITAPAYYLYLMERIVERGVIPDYIMVEVDPFQFNDGVNHFARSNVAYGFDFRFIFKYFNLFTRDEVSYFLARNVFAGFRYPPDFGSIKERMDNPLNRFLIAAPALDKYMRENRGSGKNIIPRENWYQRDFAALHLWAEKDKAWLFSNYEMSDRQFEFLQRLLDLTGKHDIEVVLVRSQVARPMARLLAEDEQLGNIMRRWDERLKAMIDGRDRVRYLDLTDHPRYYCNTFVDSSHMSLDCYYPMMQEVMRNYWERHGSAVVGSVAGGETNDTQR